MVGPQSPPKSVPLQDSDQEGGLQLGRFFAAITRNILLVSGITTLTASGAVLKAMTDVPTYQSSFELLTPPTTLETQIISTLNPEALSNQSEVVDVAVDETKLKILTSPRVMEPIVAKLQESYPGITYREVVGSLQISPDSTGNTLIVQYTDTNAEQVLHVLDVVSEAYLRFSLEDRQNNIFRGIDFVNEQLPEVRNRVEELEGELESLRQRANLIDPLSQGEQLTTQAARFSATQLDLRVEIQQAQELYQNLQQELNQGEEFAATSTLLESDRYQGLLNQMLEVDSQLADELTLYLEGSPEIEVIQERRENLQPLLEREGVRVQAQLGNYIRELQDRDQALTTTIDTLNQQIKGLSTTAREYNKIQRDLEIATVNLNQFLTKREALRIDAAQSQTPWEVLTPPGAPRASSASAKRNLVLGTVLGLLLGSGAAILIDRMKGKIHTLAELKEMTKVPVLGTVPYEKLLEGQPPLSLETSPIFNPESLKTEQQSSANMGQISTPFLEAFRILATNLQLVNPDQPIKTLTISSAVPEMGKSTITFYLGRAIAATGQRVLIVDADLRRPTLHKFCGNANAKGLSNYASGELDLQDTWASVPLEPNLYVLPSGPVPPDPTKVLSAQRTKDFFNRIHTEFDIVIFDTPPLLGLADALIISAQTQGILLVATLGQIKFSQLKTTLDELNIAKAPILGIVANNSKQRSENSYSYSYQPYPPSAQTYPPSALNTSHDIATPNGAHSKDEDSSWYRAPLKLLNKGLRNKR